MPMQDIQQPEYLPIAPDLRLHRYTDDCAFALEWYQDAETLRMVDGVARPYDLARLYRMYHCLQGRGELYFIEYKAPDSPEFQPVGDVTLCRADLPIVIGRRDMRGRGIGRRVVLALVQRARELGFESLGVQEIYAWNLPSQKLFEGVGFRAAGPTEQGSSYRLEL